MTRSRVLAAIGGVAFVGALGIAWRARPRIAVSAPATSMPKVDAAVATSAEAPVFSGCAAILRDGTCELKGAATLRVFVLGTSDRARFVVDDARLEPIRVIPLAGGTAFEIVVPIETHALGVEVDGGRALTLRIAAPLVPSPALDRARALRAAGDFDEAARVARAERDGAADDGVRARATSLLARIALSKGDEAEVDARFEESIDLEERAGRLSSAAEDAFAWVYSLIGRRRLPEAHRVLARARELSRDYPEGHVRILYYDAWIAMATARWRDALRGFEKTWTLAERLGMRVEVVGARELSCGALAALGRGSEAVDELVALYDSETAGMSECEVADMAANVGVAALEDTTRSKVDARDWLERARVLYRDTCASSYEPLRLASLLGDLARAEMTHGDLRAARARLAEAEHVTAHPRESLVLEWLRTRGEIALAEGNLVSSLAAYDALATRARAVDDAEAERVALEGRAEVLARRGDREGAATALARAADRIDQQIAEVPLGEGREGFIRNREAADARRVELLVDLGRPADALAHLRRARARVVASLWREGRIDALGPDARARWEEAVGAYQRERDALDRDSDVDWKLASSTLATRIADRNRRAIAARARLEQALADALAGDARVPAATSGAAEELLLAYQASPTGWIGFASDRRGVRSERLGRIDAGAPLESLAPLLLGPFAGEIARSRRVAVLAYGDARRIDVHALPFGGAPLIARVPVVYPIQGEAAHESESAASPRSAVLVGDPTLDLGGAHSEIDEARRALAGAGSWRTTTLIGDAATGRAVRDALGGADLFHYAGHASFAGRDGWDSALRLAERGQLDIPDILSLTRAPRVVVLLGCETGRTSDAVAAEGLGLAHAFLLAGARAAVASSRVVDDAATATLSRALYVRLARGDDAAIALQDTQRELATRSGIDWAAFRVLVP